MDEDEYQVREEIKDLRARGKLTEAYKKAMEAIDNEYNVDWSLAWILYGFLKKEYQGANPDEGAAVTAVNQKKLQGFLHVIDKMKKQGLFFVDQHNDIFWTSVQRMMVSEAWELAKAGRISELFELYGAVKLLDELEDAEPGPDSYVSKQQRPNQLNSKQLVGMDGFLYDIARPLGTAVAKLEPFDKLKALAPAIEIIENSEDSFGNILNREVVSILTFQMKQLADQKDGASLWKFWQQSAPFRKTVPVSALRFLIQPYYDTFFDKDDPAQNAEQLLTVLPGYGFDGWPDADYQPYQPENSDHAFPSFVNRILSAYLKVLAAVPATKEIDDCAVKNVEKGIKALKDHHDTGDNYMWVIYQYGKVLDRVGRLGELRDQLVELITQHGHITYLWSMLAKVYAGEDEEAERAFLEMALACPNGMLHDANTLVQLLVKKEAASHQPLLKGLLAKYPKLDQGLVKYVQGMPWYDNCQAPDDLTAALKQDAKPQVGQLLFADQERTFYVEWNNQEKNSTGIFFSSHDSAPTKLHDQKLARQVEAGQCYRAIIVTSDQHNDYYDHLKPVPDADLLKEFQFTVTENLNLVHDFGFLEPSDTFVNPELVKQYDLKNFDEVTGLVKKKWNSKKAEKRLLPGQKFTNPLETELTTIENVKHLENQRTVEGQLSVTTSRYTDREMTFLRLEDEDDVFVPNDVRGEFKNGQWVTAQLERSWNKKRQEWSWRATLLYETGGY